MRHPFFRGLRPTLHISHRGGAALAPENTLAAFEQAVRTYRTDMLELDVHATRDGEVVVSHDATVDRCTDGSGPIRELAWAELAKLDAGVRFDAYRGKGVRIPRLVEVLRAFPEVRVNLEVKPEAPGMVGRVADLLAAEGALGRVCIGSESDALARELVEALPDACHFYPRDALTEAVFALKSDEPVPESPYLVLDMPLFHHGVRLVDRALVEGAARSGRWVNVWTIDDPAEMRALVADGVGGIMTDRPDLLRAVLDERR